MIWPKAQRTLYRVRPKAMTCARQASKFTKHFLFEWDATADSPATHTESIRGPTAREDDAAIPLFAGDRMDGHDSSCAGHNA